MGRGSKTDASRRRRDPLAPWRVHFWRATQFSHEVGSTIRVLDVHYVAARAVLHWSASRRRQLSTRRNADLLRADHVQAPFDDPAATCGC
jgi:hypothetical protein